MLKVLLNSYACCPNMGSEPGMGWNWIVNLASYCELYVISEGEFKEQCEEWCFEHPLIGENIHWYWNPVSQEIRKKCWNQGDWTFYILYEKWQRKTAEIAINICRNIDINVLHQLNMVGFREPGMLYLVNVDRKYHGLTPIPLVWGPTAGFGIIPFSFMIKGGCQFFTFYFVKNILNFLELKYHYRVRKMIKVSDVLIAATHDMKYGIEQFHNRKVLIESEVGCYYSGRNEFQKVFSNSNKLKILWVGRFLYTKQLELALKTIQKLKDIEGIEFHIVGKGNTDSITNKMQIKAEELGIKDICYWHGQIPNKDVHNLMRESDIFFFTSIFEATSTVILEAISNRLPIVCFDRCGFGSVVDESIGMKIPCVNPYKSIEDFAIVIRYLNEHRGILVTMSDNCINKQIQLSWDYKIKRLVELYEQIQKPQ